MAKGQNVPSGVGYFGFKSDSDKGKAHPDKIGSGQQTVERYNGSSSDSKAASANARARSTVPSGVVRGDGTETRKGITVKHLHETNSFKKGGDAAALPGGVRKHSGLSAPKRVK